MRIKQAPSGRFSKRNCAVSAVIRDRFFSLCCFYSANILLGFFVRFQTAGRYWKNQKSMCVHGERGTRVLHFEYIIKQRRLYGYRVDRETPKCIFYSESARIFIIAKKAPRSSNTTTKAKRFGDK